LSGRTVIVGFGGSHDEAAELVEEVADNLAYDAEGDRWVAGEGWRAYHP
jgi:hypothetical protein